MAPFLDMWPVMRRVARILLAFQAVFICVDLMLTTTTFGQISTIFATLKENQEQLCVTRLVAWKTSPKNGLIFGSEKWSRKSPGRGQEVLFLDMYGYQWIYPEGIHGSPWIEIAMGYPWVGARALARWRAQLFLFK